MIPEPNYPSTKTLHSYGMEREHYRWLWFAQGGKCGCCGRPPQQKFDTRTGKAIPPTFVIDHQHVRNYFELPLEMRRRYVRGLLCTRCNKIFAVPGMTPEIAQALARYMTAFVERRGVIPSIVTTEVPMGNGTSLVDSLFAEFE